MEAVSVEPYLERLGETQPIAVYGRVTEVVGLTIEASAPPMRLGDLCYIESAREDEPVPVEVVGFRGKRAILMPLSDTTGVAPKVYPKGTPQ